MNIKLIEGQFNKKEALDLITQMIHIKIKFHENKINNNSNEEDVKYRETKIKNLQKELFELKYYLDNNGNSVQLEAQVVVK
jgi:hypothetical protein